MDVASIVTTPAGGDAVELLLEGKKAKKSKIYVRYVVTDPFDPAYDHTISPDANIAEVKAAEAAVAEAKEAEAKAAAAEEAKGAKGVAAAQGAKGGLGGMMAAKKAAERMKAKAVEGVKKGAMGKEAAKGAKGGLVGMMAAKKAAERMKAKAAEGVEKEKKKETEKEKKKRKAAKPIIYILCDDPTMCHFSHEIRRNGFTTVGRNRRTADIVVRGDPTIADEHVEFEYV